MISLMVMVVMTGYMAVQAKIPLTVAQVKT
jgi:hypothetical protein